MNDHSTSLETTRQSTRRISAGEQDEPKKTPDTTILAVAMIYEELLVEGAHLWEEVAMQRQVGHNRDELLTDWVAKGLDLEQKLRASCATATQKLGEITKGDI
jgi:hypothetical protein